MTQAALAARVKCSQSMIVRWEKGSVSLRPVQFSRFLTHSTVLAIICWGKANFSKEGVFDKERASEEKQKENLRRRAEKTR